MTTLTDTPTDSGETAPAPRQSLPAEERYATELAFLAAYDDGPRPPNWALTPRAVVTFICGSGGEALRLAGTHAGLPARLAITPKFIGERALVERCVVTLVGDRGLLLVGEPGTAKSMLSELLSAAVSGTSALTVQGTAGTTEDAFRYGWNYALLLAQAPHRRRWSPHRCSRPCGPAGSPGSRRSPAVCRRCRTRSCRSCPTGG